jgi:hypothetical protein
MALVDVAAASKKDLKIMRRKRIGYVHISGTESISIPEIR